MQFVVMDQFNKAKKNAMMEIESTETGILILFVRSFKQFYRCTNSCKTAKCGDRIVHAGVEECDDGNMIAGDGCSPSCTLEGCKGALCPCLHIMEGETGTMQCPAGEVVIQVIFASYGTPGGSSLRNTTILLIFFRRLFSFFGEPIMSCR
jgi:cysteine-rich repeat protein